MRLLQQYEIATLFMVKGKKDKEGCSPVMLVVSMPILSVVEEASHSLRHQLIVVRDEAFPGATDTFAAEQGADKEAVEDLDNDIIHEAGQCVPLIRGLLHFVSV